MELKEKIKKNLLNFPGWRTKRKIVVIESDDWGSIRMPSHTVYERILQKGIRVDKCHYTKNDSLASAEDLNYLFETLNKFKDKKGNHPIITANTIVANPAFKRIKDSGFTEYFYEPFTETLKQYPSHENVFNLWQQGMAEGLFRPQFHGREHLNVNRWMAALKSGSIETMTAFEHGLFGISTHITSEKRKSYMAALDLDNIDELEWQKTMLTDGLHLFERLFGYRSETYIATNYVWHPELEPHLQKQGVHAIQGGNSQIIPTEYGQTKIKRHFLGEKNKSGLSYLIRNALFEPSENIQKDWVNCCLKEIEIAFSWNKPAIISSHRVNYIGFINAKNRSKNLQDLTLLLTMMLKKWPDIEFMSSDKLAKLIRTKKSNE